MKKLHLILLFFLGGFLMMGVFSCQKSIFCAGSYCNAEKYTINASEGKIIAAVDTFKIHHPEMISPKNDETEGVHGDLYFVFLYYPEKKVTVNFKIKNSKILFVSQSPPGSTTTSIGINNDDVSNKENKAIKKEFETRIVNPIKAIAESL